MGKEKNKTKKVNRLKALFDIRWWFYDFVKVTGFIPVSLFLRTKYTYINKKQKKEFNNEPIMIAANHKDFLDPFLMVSVMWFKRVAVIATKELFEGKLKKVLFTGFKAICIDKENVSISTFKEVNKRINDGHSVAIFPEGTIAHDSNEIAEFKPGVILMAFMAKTPIYPIYFAKKKHWYSRQRVVIGEKFDVMQHLDGKRPNAEKMAEVANLLRQKVVELKEMDEQKYG